MNRNRMTVLTCCVLSFLAASFTLTMAKGGMAAIPQAEPGTGFIYQGHLRDGGEPANGVYDFEFSLYDAEVDGENLGTFSLEDVSITDGLFSVQIDFGADAFDGNTRWLAIGIRSGGESGAYTPLDPRQAITPSPYALYAVEAGGMEWSGLRGVPSGLDDGDDDTLASTSCESGEVLKYEGEDWTCADDDSGISYSAGFGLALVGSEFNVISSTIQTRIDDSCPSGQSIRQINADGSVVCEFNSDPNDFWSLTGNAGTTTEENYLGTTDGVSLTLVVGGMPALRLEPTSGTPNLIGGYSGNQVSAGVLGAVIGGGGAEGWPINQATDNYAVVGGGYGNHAGNADGDLTNRSYATVSGGVDNLASGEASTVGGGETNYATGSHAAIAGGSSNVASGNYAAIVGGIENSALAYGAAIGGGEVNTVENDWAVIGGGWGNQNNGDYGTIAGGYDNTVNGNRGTIPGGASNVVDEEYGFAAGRRAIAAHQGAFVWADSTDADYSSSAPNQFAVRASGGVVFNTGGADFRVDGAQVWTEGNDGEGSGLEADLLDGLEGNAYQERVTGSCEEGSYILKINADGTVECQPESTQNLNTVPTMNLISSHDATNNVGEHTSITIGADGFPIISYFDRLSEDLKVAHCNDVYCETSSVHTLDTGGIVGRWTSIVTGSDGLAIISYEDGTNADLKVAHCENLECSTVTASTIDSGGSIGTLGTSIAIGADGLAVISYFDNTNSHLKVAHCDNAACTSATLNTVDSNIQVGRYSEIAIGADGLPVMSYFNDWPNYDLKVAHCNDIACSSASIHTLDTSGDVGRETSITIGADGLPIISYQDFTNLDLKVAHCDDQACTSASIFTLDSSGRVGEKSSITIGADGFPVISYLDWTNYDLKVAHCSVLTCAEATTISVDMDGNVGDYTAITVGIDGLPVISYFDGGTNCDLKVVHCSSPFCVPYWRRR